MLRWLLICGSIGVLVAGVVLYFVGIPGVAKQTNPEEQARGKTALSNVQGPIGSPLKAVERKPVASREITPGKSDPIVLSECHFSSLFTEEVPARHEGQLLVIGSETFDNPKDGQVKSDHNRDTAIMLPRILRELTPKELTSAPNDKVIRKVFDKPDKGEPTERFYLPAGDRDLVEPNKFLVEWETHWFHDLKIGDKIKKGQLIGIVDPSNAVDELSIRATKLNAKEADRVASQKTYLEAVERYKTLERLQRNSPGSVPAEDVRGAELTATRYFYEEIGKRGEVAVSERELAQAATLLHMHEIRSGVNGEIKILYKQNGEAVKALDPVLQVHNEDDLQLEGYAGIQFLDALTKNRDVVVEPRLQQPHDKILSGHHLEINAVAVSGNAEKPLVVSAGEDGTVRVWDPETKLELAKYAHPIAVKALACTPPGSKYNYCLSGGADGIGRLWNLDKDGKQKPIELANQHRGTINCVAFSPDGEYCVTGGDDKSICLWSTHDGKFAYTFHVGHMGAVTSLQFIQRGDGADAKVQLVSAGRDSTILLWTPGTEGARLESVRFERRSGDVPVLGASPDGKQVVFDRGRELHLLSLESERTEAVLENSGASSFSLCALFSPDNRLLLTADGTEGRLQLWRLPENRSRGCELQQYVWNGAPTTCAAFSPHTAAGKNFVVSGTRDGSVVIWQLPTEDQVTRQITGELNLLGTSLETSASKVKIRAAIKENPGYRLINGNTATIVVYPK